MSKHIWLIAILAITLVMSSCMPGGVENFSSDLILSTPTPGAATTPLPTRHLYSPGELVDYVAQSGDTLTALASHFNTSVAEIRTANPNIPLDATTMPAGMPMKIPIYYAQFWGSPFQIIPDNLFVCGPSTLGFDTDEFVFGHSGWLKDYRAYAGGVIRTGSGIVDYVAINYSISPRLLLTLLEYQTGALSQPNAPDDDYLLGYQDYNYAGLYLQLVWAANLLNNGYYGWRTGRLTVFSHPDSLLERPDPWQNAATVGLHYYYARQYSGGEYEHAIGPQGFSKTYQDLFGNPWDEETPLIPVSLQQPEMQLPFLAGAIWAYTGGPHTGWGKGDPFAAVDFAPASSASGCVPSDEFVTAVADGLVVRVQPGVVILDLDGDGFEQTGWVILYLHVATRDRVPLGRTLLAGDAIGHPSCEGGTSTGTHIHIARKFNGEWIPADGPIPLNLDGWVARNGVGAYDGTLVRNNVVIQASTSAEVQSHLQADP